MVEVLSEVNVGKILEPVVRTLKKKDPKVLEEQIRDFLTCDVEPEEEKNEKL